MAVPQSYDGEAEGTYDLMVMRLHADHDEGHEPVVFIPGGPGEAAIPEAGVLDEHPLLEDRDLILVDPRGVGRSEPDLTCPEFDAARLAYFSSPDRDFARDLSTTRAASNACATRLRSDGIELEAFSTTALVRDLDRAREALGIEAWNLWSVSYGTRVAQEAMRIAPEAIRAVVLDSLSPIDELELRPATLAAKVEGALDLLVATCHADRDCRAAYPELASALDAVVDRYDAAPHRVTIESASGSQDAYFSGTDLTFVIWNLLKDETLIPLAPSVITALAAGDTTAVDQVAAAGLGGLITPEPFTFADGLNYAIDCRDYGALLDEDDDPSAFAGTSTATFHLLNSGSLCSDFGVGPGPGTFAEPVTSDLPTLVLVGGLDPATPAATATAAAAGFSRAALVDFPASGHALNDTSRCARSVTAAWLSSLTRPDTSCVPDTVDWVIT